MNFKTVAQVISLSAAAICLDAAPALADNPHCRQVGGGILTNFLDPSQCLQTSGSKAALCTDGTATGDLKGAVGCKCLRSPRLPRGLCYTTNIIG